MLNQFIIFLLLLLSLNLKGQSVQKKNWEYSNVVYNVSSKKKTIITNSLPRGGGLVHQQGKEYNYFIFWNNIRNESSLPLALEIKFPTLNYFNDTKSQFTVAFTKAIMSFEKVQDFDYGLVNLTNLLNKESNQLKQINSIILPQNEYLFYMPVFIHKTKWPVRAEFILKNTKLFYKITAGTDTVMVPCGGISFLK